MATDLKDYDIAVVGAGPAGILAAIYAARAGKRVVVLEKNEEIGRKILATGNGRCNISNKNITIDRYHGDDPTFALHILKDFDSVSFFESLGVKLKEEDRGRLFPTTDSAKTVVDALAGELKDNRVDVITSFTVKSLDHPSLSPLVASQGPSLGSWPLTRNDNVAGNDNTWNITSETGKTITADKLILTTGGKAAFPLGSSGDGLFWARNMGHTIVPIHAALVPLETEEDWVKDIMGIRLVANTTLIVEGKPVEHRSGDILFTHYGVSGPAAMGLAGAASQALADDKKVVLSIDMLRNISAEELDQKIADQLAIDGKKNIKNILADIVPKNLASQVLASAGIKTDSKAAEISKKQRQAIVSTLKDFQLTVKKVRPLKEAQVTAGGISTAEITDELESKIVPHLYFAGEILDIDGDSGGFNLQWCWSSGKIAGAAAGGNYKS
jgi:predicted flavoprotein YhiN